MREGLLDKTNTARSAWADTAYSSAANEAFMGKHGFISRVHCKRPKGRTMPESMRRASNKKSKVRSKVEDVFAEQKNRMGLFVRTIGIARATMKNGLANIFYNTKRLTYLTASQQSEYSGPKGQCRRERRRPAARSTPTYAG